MIITTTRYGHEYEATLVDVKHTRILVQGECKNGKAWEKLIRFDDLSSDLLMELLNHPKLTKPFAENTIAFLSYWHGIEDLELPSRLQWRNN